MPEITEDLNPPSPHGSIMLKPERVEAARMREGARMALETAETLAHLKLTARQIQYLKTYCEKFQETGMLSQRQKDFLSIADKLVPCEKEEPISHVMVKRNPPYGMAAHGMVLPSATPSTSSLNPSAEAKKREDIDLSPVSAVPFAAPTLPAVSQVGAKKYSVPEAMKDTSKAANKTARVKPSSQSKCILM